MSPEVDAYTGECVSETGKRLPFPRPGEHLPPSASLPQQRPIKVRPEKTRRARWSFWLTWFVWVIALWLLGSTASDTIRSYYGGSRLPPVTDWVSIAALAVAGGVVGGVVFATAKRGRLALMAGVAACFWAGGFVTTIPATAAVCGGDAVNGCEHVQSIEGFPVAGAAWPLVLLGGFLGQLIVRRLPRFTRSAR